MKQLVTATMIITGLLPLCSKGESDFSDSSKRLIVMADQSINRVAIADVDSRLIVWEWTPSSKVWMINLPNKTVNLLSAMPRIKSVSSGSGNNYPAMMVHSMDSGKQWYNDKVIDFSGQTLFQLAGLKMYKARWFVTNNFSYDPSTSLTTGK